jgi:hypothetical protein
VTDQGFYPGGYVPQPGPTGPPGPKGDPGDQGPSADQIWLPNPNYELPDEPQLLPGGPDDWYFPYSHTREWTTGSAPPAGWGGIVRYRREGPIVKFRGAVQMSGNGVTLFRMRPGFRPAFPLFWPPIFAAFTVSAVNGQIQGCHLTYSNSWVKNYGLTSSAIISFDHIEYGVQESPAPKLVGMSSFPGESVGYDRPLDPGEQARTPAALGLQPPPPIRSSMIEGPAR